jgi:hypothetical protein
VSIPLLTFPSLFSRVHPYSHLPIPVLTCPSLFSLAHPCSHLPIPVLTCPSLFSRVHPCSHVPIPVLTCPSMFSHVHPCLHVSIPVLTCPSLFSCIHPCFVRTLRDDLHIQKRPATLPRGRYERLTACNGAYALTSQASNLGQGRGWGGRTSPMLLCDPVSSMSASLSVLWLCKTEVRERSPPIAYLQADVSFLDYVPGLSAARCRAIRFAAILLVTNLPHITSSVSTCRHIHRCNGEWATH